MALAQSFNRADRRRLSWIHLESAGSCLFGKAHPWTHHLLFIGLGLSDDDFHEVMFDVRRIIPESSNYRFGTVLTLQDDPLQRCLWKGQLNFISMNNADEPQNNDFAVRKLEVFPDLLAAESTETHVYFLAHYYQGRMSQEDLKLRSEDLNLGAAQSRAGHSSA